MRFITTALLASALAACATAPQPVSRTAKAEAELGKLLAGKTAGAPTSCLQNRRADNMVIIDDSTVIFRDTANRVYRNDFNGGSCDNLGSGFYTLVTRTSGTGLCSGDIARVVDVSNGITVGSCSFGEFVPYTGPRG